MRHYFSAPAIDRRCLHLLLGLVLSSITGSSGALAQETLPAVTATVRHPVFPALIRNPQNPLTQILLIATQPDLHLTSLEFHLEPGSDIAAIESFEVYIGGAPGEYSTSNRYSLPVSPQGTLRFGGSHPLVVGSNVFWLSCRLKPDAKLGGYVATTAGKARTTAGSILPTPLTPTTRHRIGIALRRHRDDNVHTYRIPALATSTSGSLLCVYDMRRRMGRDLQEDIDIGLSRSVDGGQSWESPRVIMDMGTHGGLPQEQNGCSDPGLLVDRQTGEISCFAVWMNGKPGKHQWTADGSEPGFELARSAQFMRVRSSDDGRTWSAPENLTRQLKRPEWWLLAPSPQQGLQLPDGTLVMPIQGRDATPTEFSTVMTSQDHGKNWTVGGPAFLGSSECQAALLGDGSLMLNMRNERRGERHRAVAITRDLGATWVVHPTSGGTLIEPNCNGSLLRVDYREQGTLRHALVFSNPHTTTARTHQTLQVSFDDGQTWPEAHHRLLDEGRGAGYPSLTQIDPGHLGIVYEGSRAHLVFERIPLRDLGIPVDGPAQPSAKP